MALDQPATVQLTRARRAANNDAQVRELLVQSQALEQVLREVLDEDEDMEAMYLTRRCLAVLNPLAPREHEEVEMLLESYLQEVGSHPRPAPERKRLWLRGTPTRPSRTVRGIVVRVLSTGAYPCASQVGATVAELEVLTYNIEGTEKFVSFRLDSARNRLLKVDVLATASATALGLGNIVTGIFGMNLPATFFLLRRR